MMSDFRTINNGARTVNEWGKPARLTPEDTVVFHNKSMDYVNHITYNRPNYKFIVVGHHCVFVVVAVCYKSSLKDGQLSLKVQQ